MLDVSCHKTTHNGMKTVSTMNMEAILEVMNTPSAAMRIMPEKTKLRPVRDFNP